MRITHPRRSVSIYGSGRWTELTALGVSDACAVLAWIYFFGLNRVRIVRPYRGGPERNLMFVSNHQSPLDSSLIALAAFFPRLLVASHLHPWNAAAAEYWFARPPVAWLARQLRCIPVRTRGGDAGALRIMCRVLPESTMIFFPEGRRSPDGVIGCGHPGAGFVARKTHARIVPVAVHGLLEAMPYDVPRPHIGKRLAIAFGDPIPCDDLYARPITRETTHAIVDRAMAAVRRLHEEVRTSGVHGQDHVTPPSGS